MQVCLLNFPPLSVLRWARMNGCPITSMWNSQCKGKFLTYSLLPDYAFYRVEYLAIGAIRGAHLCSKRNSFIYSGLSTFRL